MQNTFRLVHPQARKEEGNRATVPPGINNSKGVFLAFSFPPLCHNPFSRSSSYTCAIPYIVVTNMARQLLCWLQPRGMKRKPGEKIKFPPTPKGAAAFIKVNAMPPPPERKEG